MKLVARRGKATYLLSDGDKGVIVDAENRERFRPMNLASILARGYWQIVDDDQNLVKRLLQIPPSQKMVYLQGEGH